MAFITHYEGVVFVGKVADQVQPRNGAVHGEYTIRNDDAVAAALRRFQFLLQTGHVVVFVAVPLRLAEPDAVNDGRVVEFVGNNCILVVEQRLKHAPIGVEGGRVQNGVFGAQKISQLPFQLLVNVLRAADKPHRRHAVAVRINGFLGGFHHAGVR